MSDKKVRHGHRSKNGKGFIILPIIFCLVTYLVLYLAFVPSFSPIISAMGMFFSDNEKDYSTEYDNIFVPVSENATVPTVTKKDSDGKEKSYVKKDSVQYPGYGVGIYAGSFVPGYGGTILVAGHNNTYFNGLKNAQVGQRVEIKTSYGNYVYEITDTAVKSANDSSAYDLSADYENLIMYTCYPFDELGLTSKRFFVYAKLVSGTQIDKGGN